MKFNGLSAAELGRSILPKTEDRAMTPPASETDHDALTRLNADYIASVQNGDVRRFEEILAADFVCTNPDCSYLDRAAFLLQTARPVTISGLTAHEVDIRIIGDVAVIHGRTSYRTADGRLGHGRYTDIWARRDGQWLAVAAHVGRAL
jgi:ketosteroid isomerase-like protein